MRERDIFIEVFEKDDPSDRSALLDEACQADAVLRGRVERLLAEHERQEGFILDAPPVAPDATMDHPRSERVGKVIRSYKLLQQIGEGGMGVVFMANQSEPIQRIVAIKIIKPGMDTRQVVNRFEAEREVRAMRFGTSAPLGSGANEAAAVPEPATSALLMIAGAIAFCISGNRRHYSKRKDGL